MIIDDVEATIGLARLIKQTQPKLYDYAFSLRSKHKVTEVFNGPNAQVLLHISSKLPAAQGCCTWIMPIGRHPTNPNAMVVIDLSKPIEPLFDLDTDQLRDRLYSKQEELAESESRPGIKLVHINRSPFVTTAKAMTEENAQRLGLDRQACLANYQRLAKDPSVFGKILAIYEQSLPDKEEDVDHALYSSGFLNDDEKVWNQQVLEAKPHNLADLAEQTQNTRLKTQLFRYRARNYPDTLDHDEVFKWQNYRHNKLTDPAGPGLSLESYMYAIEQIASQSQLDQKKQRILGDLVKYANNL